MSMVKKSITVTPQQESWIQAELAKGNYGTDSELIREALREKQLLMNEVDAIRAKLVAAEQSVEQQGWVEQNPNEMLDDFKSKARQDGKL